MAAMSAAFSHHHPEPAQVLIAPTPQVRAQLEFRKRGDALGVPIEWIDQLIAYGWQRERPTCTTLEAILWGSLSAFAGLAQERGHLLALPKVFTLLLSVDATGNRYIHADSWGSRDRVEEWVAPAPMCGRKIGAAHG